MASSRSDDTTSASVDPLISTRPDGPFVVEASLSIRRAIQVLSGRDEPMTWSFGHPVDVSGHVQDGTVSLCRCGSSDDKPFCDGSHDTADWDPSDDPQPAEPYLERARRKQAPEGVEYVLADDTALCTHAGFCATERHSVWQMLPTADDSEVLGTVIRMVEKCPSGRITNIIAGEPVEPALNQEICVTADGPLWVTGGVSIGTASGAPLETRNRVALCRCGASSNKPLCDGSHVDIGFLDPHR